MKSKVTDSGRSRADLSSSVPPPCPPAPAPVSSSIKPTNAPQLQVDKMPVFNFTSTPAPTAKPKNTQKTIVEEQKPVSPTPSPIPPEVLERNNNNKSPLKRQINETESISTDGDSPKKTEKRHVSAIGFHSTT